MSYNFFLFTENIVNKILKRSGQALFTRISIDPLVWKLGLLLPRFMNPLFRNVLVAEYFSSDTDIV